MKKIIFLSFLFSLNAFSQTTVKSYKANLHHQRMNDIGGDHFFSEKIQAFQINRENLQLIKDFTKEDTDTPYDDISNLGSGKDSGKEKADYISLEVANEVLDQAMFHPVVSTWMADKYDPEDKGIGYCFGRAMFTHLEIASRGLDRDSIKKAFVVGPMSTGGSITWGWHVSTIVQSKNRKGKEVWLAVDPIVGEVVTLKEWYEEMYHSYSTDKKLKLYITEAGKFGPTPSRYTEGKEGLADNFYHGYFIDMMKWFEDNSHLPRYNNLIQELE